jgi:hypothetical protein
MIIHSNINMRLILRSILFFSCLSQIAVAQTKTEYTGTFTNSTLTQSGLVTMSLIITLPDSINGYMNFSQQAGQSPLCGAGLYKGRIVNTDSLYYSFSSNDTDNNCGFDAGWLFTLKGRFYANKDSIAGAYHINNANNELGFFNLKRVGATAVAGPGQPVALFYPCPASDKLMIRFPSAPKAAMLSIVDQLGVRVLAKQLTAATTEVSLQLPDGIYFINIASGGQRTTQKLLIRH